jgi:hypothetical protein
MHHKLFWIGLAVVAAVVVAVALWNALHFLWRKGNSGVRKPPTDQN